MSQQQHQQLTEQDYKALCAALQKWCAESEAERDEQFQWRFVGEFCADPDEWTRRHDPHGYIARFLVHDAPTSIAVAFYMRQLASGQGEFTVFAEPIAAVISV